MRGTVESPTFKKTFVVGDNTPKVDAHCPIDGTQLVSVTQPDFSNYRCAACGAEYKWGDKDPDSLREQAVRYATEVRRRAGDKRDELAKLEAILQAAEQNGI